MGESLYGNGLYGAGKYSYSPYVPASASLGVKLALAGSYLRIRGDAADLDIATELLGSGGLLQRSAASMVIPLSMADAASVLHVAYSDLPVPASISGRGGLRIDAEGVLSVYLDFVEVDSYAGPVWIASPSESEDWQDGSAPDPIWTPISAPQVN